MAWLTSILLEPFYRKIWGQPLRGLAASELRAGDGDVSRQAGLVIVADGVGGLDLCGTGLRYVSAADRLPYAIELFPWGHGFGRWIADLIDVANRDTQATSIAMLVRRFKTTQPDDPVFLVAKSGGSGVVVQALEQLDDQTVERVVLLAPALSPGYDLSRALRAVRREAVVFWSPFDIFVLGLGTSLLGTIDRVFTRSAGLVGFRVPPQSQEDATAASAYAKLRQVRWQPEMAASAHFGGHVGPDSPFFLKKYVVPLLRVDGRDKQ
jgi:hypothetical protein